MPKVLLVIPCYNEAGRLPVQHFLDFSAQHDDIAFIFVNDGSTDRTQAVIDGLTVQNPALFSSLALEHNSLYSKNAVPARILFHEMYPSSPPRLESEDGAIHPGFPRRRCAFAS